MWFSDCTQSSCCSQSACITGECGLQQSRPFGICESFQATRWCFESTAAVIDRDERKREGECRLCEQSGEQTEKDGLLGEAEMLVALKTWMGFLRRCGRLLRHGWEKWHWQRCRMEFMGRVWRLEVAGYPGARFATWFAYILDITWGVGLHWATVPALAGQERGNEEGILAWAGDEMRISLIICRHYYCARIYRV